MGEINLAIPHSLTLSQRNRLTMTGVAEVTGFDDNTVVLRTELGDLMVLGRDLKLKVLSPEGNITIEGAISGLQYEEPRPAGGWIRRLLG